MKVRFCRDCGRMILATFPFCPYCGAEAEARKETDFRELVSPSIDRLDSTPSEPTASMPRLDRMLEDLDALDRELDAIILQREAESLKR